MKTNIFFLSVICLAACSPEPCIIDYEAKPELFEKSLTKIWDLNLEMNSTKDHWSLLKTIKKKDHILDEEVFEEVQFVDCHKDSTIIFQAPNCNKGSALRDLVSVLVFSPKGELHISTKRNMSGLKKIKENWYSGFHVRTIAN